MGLLDRLSKTGRELVERFAWVARQHAGAWMQRYPDDDLDEVQSAAMYGLVLGAGSYDPDRSDNPEGWIARRIAGTLQDLVARKRGDWGDNRKLDDDSPYRSRVDIGKHTDTLTSKSDIREQLRHMEAMSGKLFPDGYGNVSDCSRLLGRAPNVVWRAALLVQADTAHVCRWVSARYRRWHITSIGVELVAECLAVRDAVRKPMPVELPKKDQLTAEEVATALRLPDRRAVYRAVSRGDLPEPLRFGVVVVFPRKELAEFLESKRVKRPTIAEINRAAKRREKQGEAKTEEPKEAT